MKRKDIAVLVVLIAAIGLCVGAYFLLKSWNERDAETPTTTVTDLENVKRVTFTANDGQTLTFSKEGDEWAFEADPTFPLDETYVDAIVSALSPLEADRTFSQPDSLSAYGLESSAATVRVQTETGEETAVLIGNQYSGSYYAKVEGAGTVYTIDATLYHALDVALLDMVAIPTLPGAAESALTSVTVKSREGENLYTKTAVETPSEVEGEEPTVTYTWSKNGETLTEEERETVSDLVSALRAPSLTSCYDYKGSDESVEICGLLEPVTVTVDYEGGSYTLSIGSALESGGGYYVMLEGEMGIFVLSSALAEPMLAAAP